MQVSKYTASSFISIPSLDTNNVSETADINESIISEEQLKPSSSKTALTVEISRVP